MIQRCREDFPVSMMCRALKVSSSGYYEWRARPPGVRSQDMHDYYEKSVACMKKVIVCLAVLESGMTFATMARLAA